MGMQVCAIVMPALETKQRKMSQRKEKKVRPDFYGAWEILMSTWRFIF